MFSIYNFDFNYIDIISIGTIYLIATMYACNTLFFNNILRYTHFMYAIIALISIMASFLIYIFTKGEIKFLYPWTIPSVIMCALFFTYISNKKNDKKEKVENNNNYNYNEEYNYSKTRCNFSHKNCYFDFNYKDYKNLSEVEKKQQDINNKKLQEIKDFNKGITRNKDNVNNEMLNIDSGDKKIENKLSTKIEGENIKIIDKNNNEDDILLSNNTNNIQNRVNYTKLVGVKKEKSYNKKNVNEKINNNDISVLDMTEKTLEDKIIVQVKKVASELINKEEKSLDNKIKQMNNDVQMLRDSLQGVINRMAKLFSLMTATMKN